MDNHFYELNISGDLSKTADFSVSAEKWNQ